MVFVVPFAERKDIKQEKENREINAGKNNGVKVKRQLYLAVSGVLELSRKCIVK